MSQLQRRAKSFTPLLSAVSALALGVLVYVTARAPGSAYFLPAAWSAELPWPQPAQALAGSLPSFFHTLGFSLLLTVMAGAGRRAAALACGIWFAVEAAFEAGQHPRASAWLAEHLPQWFEHVWLLERTGAYFNAGVFDPLDIVAAAAGAILAYLLVAANEPERRQSHERFT